MASNEQIAKDVLEAVGGSENVSAVTHCMTRLRFNLVDQDVPNDDAVKEIPGVLGVVRNGGQYQVVIGQNVSKVYPEVCKLGGFESKRAVEENPDVPAAEERLTPKAIGGAVMDYLSGSMTPVIPSIMAAAMFKTIATIFGGEMLGLIPDGSDLAILLELVYNAGFYFFPVYLGYTAAKKLNTSIPIGMFLGGILIAPGLIELATEGTPFSVYGIPCSVYNYSSSVIPIILSVWVMSYVHRFIDKYMPNALSTVFTPFLTVAVMLPIMLCALAPLGNFIGSYLAVFLDWLSSVGGGIAVGFVGAVYCFLVMTGMHSPLAMIGIGALFSTGYDSLLFVAASCAMCACCGMTLAAFLRLKNSEEKALSMGYLVTLLACGITEPSLYGIGVRYKKPFIGLAAGGLAGGLYAGFTHVTYHALIAPIVLYPFAFSGGGASNMVNGIIGCVISFAVALAVTLVTGFDKGSDA